MALTSAPYLAIGILLLLAVGACCLRRWTVLVMIGLVAGVVVDRLSSGTSGLAVSNSANLFHTIANSAQGLVHQAARLLH